MENRLQQFLAAENLTQSQFADSIGVGRASVSHILAGRNKPGYDFIERMASRYSEINLDWLITGKGKMYKKDKSSDKEPALFPEEEKKETAVSEPIPEMPQTEASENQESEETHEEGGNDSRHEKKICRIMVFYDDGTYQEIH